MRAEPARSRRNREHEPQKHTARRETTLLCSPVLRTEGARPSPPMTYELAIVLVLLAAAMVIFAITRPRMDVVALIMLTILPFTGVITMGEALAGFSDSTIVLLAALFVIGEGLVRTGVAQQLGDWLNEKAGSSERRLLVLLMAAVAGLGAFMSSTGVVPSFISVNPPLAQHLVTAPSHLMMPLSVAAPLTPLLNL